MVRVLKNYWGLGFLLALFMALGAASGQAFAEGGVGTGGGGQSGSGGSGWWSSYGYGWRIYTIDSGGPNAGFKDGTSWQTVTSKCASSTDTVAVFVVNNSNRTSQRGYNAWTWKSSSYLSTSPYISMETAQAAYNALPNELKAGFTWGTNVGWFCYGSKPKVATLDGVKIDGSGSGQYGGGTHAAFNSAAVSVADSGSDSRNPFYFTNDDGGGNAITAGTRQVSLSAVPSGWQLLGYSICDGADTCNSDVLKYGGAHFTPLSGGSKSFNYTFAAGHSYHMRWIFTAINSCANFSAQPASYPGTPPQPGEAFTISGTAHYVTDASKAAAAAGNNFVMQINGQTIQGQKTADGYLSLDLKFDVTGGIATTGRFTYNIAASGSVTINNCTVTIAAKPYVQAWVGDIVAGAAWPMQSGSCGAAEPGAGIAAWNTNQPGYAGSGAKNGVFAAGLIAGFASAQSSRASGLGVTFANTNNNNPQQDKYGGQFGAGGNCWHMPTAGVEQKTSTTQENLTVTKGQHPTYHYRGNVYIRGNVVFQDGWASLREIPSFTLVADGDIYIDAGVTRLDGTYVARANSAGVGGRIYTCTQSAAPTNVADGQFFSTCARQLVINGSLVAKKVYLTRTCGTVRLAAVAEPLTFQGGSCTGSDRSHAAEVINNGPADWQGRSNDTGGRPSKWDSVVSLPPVL